MQISFVSKSWVRVIATMRIIIAPVILIWNGQQVQEHDNKNIGTNNRDSIVVNNYSN